jgi:acetylornithine deacetylase/succinyl-diaminopimelate desuccinylase-like protein
VKEPGASQPELSRVLDHLAAGRQGALARLFRLLSIPSVSTDPSHHQACVAAAEWCAKRPARHRLSSPRRADQRQAMVVGHWRRASSPLRVLFYGHYDVQPADPLEEWTTPPFAPRLAEDPRSGETIVARGASDDKGQGMTFIEGLPLPACRS